MFFATDYYALPPLPQGYDPNSPPRVPEHATFPPTYTAQTELSFELALLACSTRNSPHPKPYESCCVLENRFLLLGCIDSVQLIDLNHPELPKPIIWTRVRYIKVIESCRTIMMVSGRHRHVRCYSLDAILILCYAVLGLNWSQRENPANDVPDYQTWRKGAAVADTPKRSLSDNSIVGGGVSMIGRGSINSESNSTHLTCTPSSEPHHDQAGRINLPVTKDPSPSLTLAGGSGLGKLYYLYKGIIPQDYFFKLPDSKDVRNLDLYLTSACAFAAVITKEKVAIWQRPRHEKSQPWQRLKVFCIPTGPQHISLADDRSTLRYVIAVFRGEATVINLRTSKVQTIQLEQPVIERFHKLEQQKTGTTAENHPSQSSPLPINEPNRNFRTTSSYSIIPWNSLRQLPFYPNTLPPTSLTEEYSVPPPYSLVADEPLDTLHDPVALPSTAAPQLFLATLSRHSFIIDLSGSLFSRTTYSWSEEPLHIELAKIVIVTESSSSSTEKLCIIGFLSQSVEIMDVRTGELIHAVPMKGPVRYLGRWDENSIAMAFLWTCDVIDRTYVYMLRLKYNPV
ncbi:unnamed protein product [Umbelopsis vinacea]